MLVDLVFPVLMVITLFIILVALVKTLNYFNILDRNTSTLNIVEEVPRKIEDFPPSYSIVASGLPSFSQVITSENEINSNYHRKGKLQNNSKLNSTTKLVRIVTLIFKWKRHHKK
uniref:CSON009761 protein n=1 Tax=Culicoides sonorensis TaxID=179676 RepID=A0A336M1E1_CULSO